MKRIGLLIGVAIAISLGACSSKNNVAGGGLMSDTAKKMIAARKAKRSGVKPKPLSRASIANVDQSIAQISVPRAGVKSLFTMVSQNGSNRTFLNKGGKTFTIRNNKLVATRGLEFDLMAMGSSGSNDRTYRYLTPENHLAQIQFRCEFEGQTSETITIVEKSYTLARVEEVCKSPTHAFKNRYWISQASGKVWKSEQWIGPQMGHAIIEILNN
ncbi:hypothetical protein GCM10008927_12530 [Amylibacter ulvae]|uniref:Group 4 capsule polysaccharide lipoprotein gfcB, YjbF n=1 Tax=Paramylibacter ulvae TaxID=1651968 RepID=A0ABQ3CZJ9_9RHOB|nr:YjbF family lipoprotein [Amylibacter ulvae]GHA48880.1 hypothetical protein GCM10008927_12530 [Amylibacter ulvae]